MDRKREIIIFGITILLLILFFQYYKFNFDKDILKNGEESVAKIEEINTQSRRKAFDFVFYSKGKLIKSSGFRENFPNVKIGKFYKVFYLSDNTEKNFIDLEKEVTDTEKILEAGFSREVLKAPSFGYKEKTGNSTD
jgi:hypothetical protein